MPHLTQEQLEALNFKKLGKNIKISDKTTFYYPHQIEIGDNTRIDDFCVISGNIVIGKYVHIAPFCLIAGGEKGITLGDFCGVSYASQIFTQSDDYTGQFMVSPLIPEKFKREYKAPVKLDKHVIIGANSIVFPGVHIEEGCSIGAMSLVNKNTKPWGIYIGIPAKRVKEKSKDILRHEEEFLAEISLS